MSDALPVDAMAADTRERMRDMGRVPRRLSVVVVELPEVPMGNEAGADVTHHMLFEDAVKDPGKLGALVRALTRNPVDG